MKSAIYGVCLALLLMAGTAHAAAPVTAAMGIDCFPCLYAASEQSEAMSTQLHVTCHADLPVVVGDTLTWEAQVDAGGSGQYHYSWEHSLGGAYSAFGVDSPTTSDPTSSVGAHWAIVTVTDAVTGQSATSNPCLQHVMPKRDKPPYNALPSVTPVLWAPKGVTFTSADIEQVDRAFRITHQSFYREYGKTYHQNPLVQITSTLTEQEICGVPECVTKFYMGPGTSSGADQVANQAWTDSNTVLGNLIPYTTAREIIVWGAGAWAGSFSWDMAIGRVGDYAGSAIMGVQSPPIEPNFAEFVARHIGQYWSNLSGALAHEMNNVVGWDDNYSLDTPRSADEVKMVLAGPFMVETPDDGTPPTVAITSPANNTIVSDTVQITAAASDNQGIDAVLFLVDDHLFDTEHASPYTFNLDTTKLNLGFHTVRAFAVDLQGNYAWKDVEIDVENPHAGGCSTSYSSTNQFKACFYGGTAGSGGFLEQIPDPAFPFEAPNAGYLINHTWAPGAQLINVRAENISATWRGHIDLPNDTYLFEVTSSSGVRFTLNDSTVIYDQLTSASPQNPRIPVSLTGPQNVRVDWYGKPSGSAGSPANLTVFVKPTTMTSLVEPTISLVSPNLAVAYIYGVDPGTDVQFTVDTTADTSNGPAQVMLRDMSKGDIGAAVSSPTIVPNTSPTTMRWTVDWKPKVSDEGHLFQLEFDVTDANGQMASVGTFFYRVNVVPNPVFVLPDPAQMFATYVTEGQLYRLNIQAQATTPVTYTYSGLPAGAVTSFLGDVNGDGATTVADSLALQALYGQTVTTAGQVKADVNGDGKIDSSDGDALTTLINQGEPPQVFAWLPGYNAATSIPTSDLPLTVTATSSTGSSQKVIDLTVVDEPFISARNVLGSVGSDMIGRLTVQDDLGPVSAIVSAPNPSGSFGGLLSTTQAGDLDQDGVVGSNDSTILTNHANGVVTLTPFQLQLGDINGDGDIDVADFAGLISIMNAALQPDLLWHVIPQASDIGEHLLLNYALNGSGGTSPDYKHMVILDQPVLTLTILNADMTPTGGVPFTLCANDSSGAPQCVASFTDEAGVATYRNLTGTGTLVYVTGNIPNLPLGAGQAQTIAGSTTWPQVTTGTGAVAGVVTDASGPLRNAFVQLNGSGGLAATLTGAKGEYGFTNVPPGSYDVTVIQGKRTFTPSTAFVAVDNTVEVQDFVGSGCEIDPTPRRPFAALFLMPAALVWLRRRR